MNSIFNNLGADNTTTKAIIIMGCICVYMLPFIVAFFRGNENKNKWFWVNLLLGWTIGMWLLCLVKILKEPKGEIFKEDDNSSNKEEDKTIIRNTETNIYDSSYSSIDTNTNTIKIKFNHLVVIIVIITIVVLLVIGTLAGSIFNFNKISNKQMIEIIENSDMGSYVQSNTVKVGSMIDINYKSFDKLITYSCILKNNDTNLNAGGVALYNKSNKNSKVISLKSDLMSLIYYLNTEEKSDKLEKTSNIIADYISKYGDDILNNVDSIEEYMNMGKEIGKVVGTNLCRNAIKDGTNTLGTLNQLSFLFKQSEIFPRYIGTYVTETEYQWGFLFSETSMRILMNSNPTSYRNLIAIYGEPYKTVKNFYVYDFTKENTPQVGKYSDISEARKNLGVE